MGSAGLHDKFIGRNDNEKRDRLRQHKVSQVVAGVAGIDISGTFHRCLATQTGAASFDVEPPIPPQNALKSVMKELQLAQSKAPNATLVAVLDGVDHPMKKATKAKRDRDRKEALAKLDVEYAKGEFADYDAVKKLRRSIVYRREDFTKIFPFEAEWMLVGLQLCKLIDVIISDTQ